MSWKAIETENGEAQVIDAETNQVIARIVSGPFEGIKTAEWIAAAPDTLRLLATSAYKTLANLRQEIDSQEEQ